MAKQKKNELSVFESEQKALTNLDADLRALFEPDPDSVSDYESFNEGTLPVADLMQSMHDSVSDGTYKAGQVVDQTAGLVYLDSPEDVMEVVPVYQFKSRILFGDSGFDCRSDDGITGVGDPGGECPSCFMAQFHGSAAPKCVENNNVVCLVLTENDGVQVTTLRFKKTSLKVGREFMRTVRSISGRARMFTNSYLIGVRSEKQKSGAGGTFYNFELRKFENGRLNRSLVEQPEVLREAVRANELVKHFRNSGSLKIQSETVNPQQTEEDDHFGE
jgi:hypothetical protein